MREHVSTGFIFYQWTFCNVPILRENEEIMDFVEEKKGRNTDCFFFILTQYKDVFIKIE